MSEIKTATDGRRIWAEIPESGRRKRIDLRDSDTAGLLELNLFDGYGGEVSGLAMDRDEMQQLRDALDARLREEA